MTTCSCDGEEPSFKRTVQVTAQCYSLPVLLQQQPSLIGLIFLKWHGWCKQLTEHSSRTKTRFYSCLYLRQQQLLLRVFVNLTGRTPPPPDRRTPSHTGVPGSFPLYALKLPLIFKDGKLKHVSVEGLI